MGQFEVQHLTGHVECVRHATVRLFASDHTAKVTVQPAELGSRYSDQLQSTLHRNQSVKTARITALKDHPTCR